MTVIKLAFLFTLVVVFRRDWLERQLARHLARIRRLLASRWWPGVTSLPPAGDPEGRGADSWQWQAATGSVHAARITDRMLAEQGRPSAAVGWAGAPRDGAGSSRDGGRRSARALEAHWEKRRRAGQGARDAGGKAEIEKTLLELVTERRRRGARATERHAAVREHLRRKRGVKPPAEERDGDAGKTFATTGGMTRTAARRNWRPGDLLEDINGESDHNRAMRSSLARQQTLSHPSMCPYTRNDARRKSSPSLIRD